MGHSQSKQSSVINSSFSKKSKHIQIQNWQLVETPQLENYQLGSFSVMKNQATNQVTQVYTLHFNDSVYFQNYIQEFDNWRSENRQNITQAKYLYVDQSSPGIQKLCSNFYIIKLFIEYSPITLSQIKDIPPPQSFYILLSSLYGFEYLYEIFGYFPIRQSMITVNQQGIVKVWINPDLSKNRPLPHRVQFFTNQQSKKISHAQNAGLGKYSHSQKKQTPRQQSRFIQELINLIQKNTDYTGYSNTFKKYIENYKNLNFKTCRIAILNFAEQIQVDLPNSLLSILDILFQKTNKTSVSHQNMSSSNQQALYGKNYQNSYLLGQQAQFNVKQASYQSPEQQRYVFGQQQFRGEVESFNKFHRKISETSEPIQLPKNLMRYQNSTPNQSSQYKSPQRQSSVLQSVNNYEFNEFNLIGQNRNTNSTPHMTFSYTYQTQSGQYFPMNTEMHRNDNQMQQHFFGMERQARQYFKKQSTIRQQVQEDSFLTSYKNSKFQTSRDAKRASNQIKGKTITNPRNHNQTGSSNSGNNIMPNQEIESRQRFSNQQNLLLMSNQIQRQRIARKSITFYSPNQFHQLDSQIARDLEQMLTSIIT